MIVALLQVNLDRKSGSANVQAIMQLLHSAVSVSPAPDLLVLPAAVDTGGVVGGDSWPDALVRGVRESLSFEARDWGVFLAAGIQIRHEGMRRPGAVLIDPDGDIIACHVVGEGAQDGLGAIGSVAFSCALGRVGVWESTRGQGQAQLRPIVEPADILVVPGIGRSSGKLTKRDQEAHDAVQAEAQLANAYFCVTVPATSKGKDLDDPRQASFVVAPDGHIIASATTTGETVVTVDIQIGRERSATVNPLGVTRDDPAG